MNDIPKELRHSRLDIDEIMGRKRAPVRINWLRVLGWSVVALGLGLVLDGFSWFAWAMANGQTPPDGVWAGMFTAKIINLLQ